MELKIQVYERIDTNGNALYNIIYNMALFLKKWRQAIILQSSCSLLLTTIAALSNINFSSGTSICIIWQCGSDPDSSCTALNPALLEKCWRRSCGQALNRIWIRFSEQFWFILMHQPEYMQEIHSPVFINVIVGPEGTSHPMKHLFPKTHKCFHSHH